MNYSTVIFDLELWHSWFLLVLVPHKWLTLPYLFLCLRGLEPVHKRKGKGQKENLYAVNYWENATIPYTFDFDDRK